MNSKVVITSACRTPIGKMSGVFKNTSAVELGTIVIKEALKRSSLEPEQVDQVLMGCVLQGGQGQNIARQCALNAGLPVQVPAVTMNVVCGSGLESVNMAARMIRTGEADIVVAGGTENMTMAPYLLQKAREGYRLGNGELVDSMVNDALWDVFNDYHMGITAENIAELWDLSREELDRFAVDSQQKAAKAKASGRFENEIVPISVKARRKEMLITEDEGIRPDSTMEGISGLRPAFKKDGVVTAANSSTINDGAAGSGSDERRHGQSVERQADGRWVAGALAGVEPSIMGIGPVEAAKKVLKKADMTIDDLDLVEANEAFAAQSVAVARELSLDMEKLNVNGGAIALGHPVGASGTRILVTLLYEMEKRDAKTGLATLCIGGGMGCATVVERP